MVLKTFGAICVTLVCGGFGLNLAYCHMNELKTLQKLLAVLEFMENELRFRLTTLPRLCKLAALECDGVVQKIFLQLSSELQEQAVPDVKLCFMAAIAKVGNIPPITREALQRLSVTLGRFDLVGQLKGFEAVRNFCRLKLDELNREIKVRVRGYQTLGLCAGAALVILFI